MEGVGKAAFGTQWLGRAALNGSTCLHAQNASDRPHRSSGLTKGWATIAAHDHGERISRLSELGKATGDRVPAPNLAFCPPGRALGRSGWFRNIENPARVGGTASNSIYGMRAALSNSANLRPPQMHFAAKPSLTPRRPISLRAVAALTPVTTPSEVPLSIDVEMPQTFSVLSLPP